jgi:hypothetical protein
MIRYCDGSFPAALRSGGRAYSDVCQLPPSICRPCNRSNGVIACGTTNVLTAGHYEPSNGEPWHVDSIGRLMLIYGLSAGQVGSTFAHGNVRKQNVTANGRLRQRFSLERRGFEIASYEPYVMYQFLGHTLHGSPMDEKGGRFSMIKVVFL